MTALDDKLLPKVKEIIDRLGKAVTFKVRTAGTYDPEEGKYTSETITTYPDVVVSPPFPAETKYFPNEVMQQSDLQVILPANNLTWTIDGSQEVVIDALTLRIVSVGFLYSGTSIAAYVLLLRK